jgi:hypothetical protein
MRGAVCPVPRTLEAVVRVKENPMTNENDVLCEDLRAG